jgi:hypothetical protein
MKSKAEHVEEAPLLAYKQSAKKPRHASSWASTLAVIISGAALLSGILLIARFVQQSHSPQVVADLEKRVQKCSIDNFHRDLSFLDKAAPITAHEFLDRRDKLARALVKNGVDAFVLEPGYTFQ